MEIETSKLLTGMLIVIIVKYLVPIDEWHWQGWERFEFGKQFAIGSLMTMAAIVIALFIWAYFQVVLPMEAGR